MKRCEALTLEISKCFYFSHSPSCPQYFHLMEVLWGVSPFPKMIEEGHQSTGHQHCFFFLIIIPSCWNHGEIGTLLYRRRKCKLYNLSAGQIDNIYQQPWKHPVLWSNLQKIADENYLALITASYIPPKNENAINLPK